MMAATFGITAIAHPALRDVREACEDCLTLGHDAAVMARATGSVGATYGQGDHSATVARILDTVTLD